MYPRCFVHELQLASRTLRSSLEQDLRPPSSPNANSLILPAITLLRVIRLQVIWEIIAVALTGARFRVLLKIVGEFSCSHRLRSRPLDGLDLLILPLVDVLEPKIARLDIAHLLIHLVALLLLHLGGSLLLSWLLLRLLLLLVGVLVSVLAWLDVCVHRVVLRGANDPRRGILEESLLHVLLEQVESAARIVWLILVLVILLHQPSALGHSLCLLDTAGLCLGGLAKEPACNTSDERHDPR
mmetsp:Transcript_2129/g.6355  ORF Transcript_2129/g.6355 Transcript_2129/m.6355 type:complete len:241 (-) Transcript_2129:177-899(-)